MLVHRDVLVGVDVDWEAICSVAEAEPRTVRQGLPWQWFGDAVGENGFPVIVVGGDEAVYGWESVVFHFRSCEGFDCLNSFGVQCGVVKKDWSGTYLFCAARLTYMVFMCTRVLASMLQLLPDEYRGGPGHRNVPRTRRGSARFFPSVP